jgi:two-component system, NarL family, sensor histidine kinase UhpB
VRKIWNVLSFRQRLLLPVALMILSAVASGAVALFVFSPDHFEYENEQESGSVRAVARALNGDLEASRNPEQTLAAFGKGLGDAEAIRYLPAGTREPVPPLRGKGSRVPAWFVSNLTIPDLAKSYPVNIGPAHAGDIAIVPDPSADIWEKWVGFVAILSTGSLPMLLAAFGAHLIAGRSIVPMERLGAGLVRMREGDYHTVIPLVGPPEIRQFCREANRLAATLRDLSRDNRDLLRRLVSLQDDERRHMARELHDEMGPLLFAIRANAAAIADEAAGVGRPVQGHRRRGRSPAAGQQADPAGLEPALSHRTRAPRKSRGAVARRRAAGSRPTHPTPDRTSSGHSRRAAVADGLSRCPGRRHQRASSCRRIDDGCHGENYDVVIEIADDGRRTPDIKFGRGLTGMSERVRALAGNFQLAREDERTIVRCSLPIPANADVRGT